jgi:hypothetical protein
MSGGADHRKELSCSHPQYATEKSDELTQAFVSSNRWKPLHGSHLGWAAELIIERNL